MLNNTLKECKNTTDKIPIIIKGCRQCGKTYQKKLPPWKIFPEREVFLYKDQYLNNFTTNLFYLKFLRY